MPGKTNNKPEYLLARIIQQLRLLRLTRGMSHGNLARKAGITRPAVSHIENGKRRPTLLVAIKIANALGKNLSDIVRMAEK